MLHVLPHPGGGGERYVDTLASLPGYATRRVHLVPSETAARRGLLALRGAMSVRRAAAEADLVHAHGETAALLSLPALAGRCSVFTPHGLNVLRRAYGWRRRLAIAGLRRLVRAARRTICVSNSEHQDLVAALGEEAAARAAVVPNGVVVPRLPTPEERAGARRTLGIAGEVVVGVMAGVLEPHKDPLTAVRAAHAAALSGAPMVLLLAGEGSLRAEVDQAARAAGGSVRVLGRRHDMSEVFAAADFFCLPSRREGLSFALLEAMALALPCVVSDVPGNTEAVGDAGLLAPAGDTAAFAQAFRHLVHHADARTALGSRSRERVSRFFSAAEMLRRTREVYEEALSQGR